MTLIGQAAEAVTVVMVLNLTALSLIRPMDVISGPIELTSQCRRNAVREAPRNTVESPG